MPRLSLWTGQHNNNYRFIDRHVKQQFTIGGTDLLIHKYLGVTDQGNINDLSQPSTINQTELAIQDFLLLENRDRNYEKDLYTLRGHYTTVDVEINNEQWGGVLNEFPVLTFHINDMVERIGRKIMTGDVIEFPHLEEFWALNDSVPVALKRYYVVEDATRAGDGFSPTWWPHLWRVTTKPLTDSQEFAQIVSRIEEGTASTTIRDLLSVYEQELANNQAVVDQAEAEVPKSGYDTDQFYVKNVVDGTGNPEELTETPGSNGWIDGYLTGDGLAPNGYTVTSGVAFPNTPSDGDYVLRVDYLPNRLFRYNGTRWVKVEDVQRTSLTPGSGQTLRDTFINNTNTTILDDNNLVNQRVALSKVLKPTEDN